MSSFLFSASITLVLLSILPLSIADLVDLDGDLIENGKAYYIIPISTDTGLTYTQKNKECPLYITTGKTGNTPGTPVIISNPSSKKPFISLDQRVSLAFEDVTVCDKTLVWRQTIDPLAQKLYITTGDKTIQNIPFSITKTDRSLIPMYEIKYWPSSAEGAVSSNVGLYKDDGLLGIIEDPTPVYFKKAFDVLKLPKLPLKK